MDDKPRFPSPDEWTNRQNDPDSAAPTTTAPAEVPSTRLTVTRAEPPPEEADGGGGDGGGAKMRKAALTPEEVRALLATQSSVARPRMSARRRFAILVPVGLVEWALDTWIGSTASLVFSVLAFVAVIAWATAPLFRKSDWD